MKQLLLADFRDIKKSTLDRILIAAGYDHTVDRVVAFGPMSSMQAVEILFEMQLRAAESGAENGVIILPSGNDDKAILHELKVRQGMAEDRSLMVEAIAKATDTLRSTALDPATYGPRPRVSYLTYDGFEVLTGIGKFSKAKELIQTSHFAPHAFLSIIRPLYLVHQDASYAWVVQPMPDTETEYIHHRRLRVFKGIRETTEAAGKVITLNKHEKDLGICHSYDILLQQPGGQWRLAENHDRVYARIMSRVTPSERQIANVSQGGIHCNPLSPGYAHLINLGRVRDGHFAIIYTKYRRLNDLLTDDGLPPVGESENAHIPGIGFFNVDIAATPGYAPGLTG